MADRVNTTFATWMGTTMACAQCHTHKYDPITHEEYFKVFDILNQTEDFGQTGRRAGLHLRDEASEQRRVTLRKQIEELKGRIKMAKPVPEPSYPFLKVRSRHGSSGSLIRTRKAGFIWLRSRSIKATKTSLERGRLRK